MVTRKLKSSDKAFLKTLGRKIEKTILVDKGYRSLDAFALEFHDLITKPTLYQICAGQRDMKISTLRGLCKALEIDLARLIQE